MIKAVHTVIAETAMGGPWWPKDLASKAVLEFHRLSFDQDFFCAWWWSIRGTVKGIGHLWNKTRRIELLVPISCPHERYLTDLLLDVRCLIVTGPWNNARVSERRAK